MQPQEYSSQTLDHLGLVAGMCQEIGISDLIDRCCPSESPERIVSTGKAVEAMLLNGLGFVNKRLYLVSHFFRDKPLELLLGPGLDAAHLNDDRLGRALDELYETGLTTIFTKLSRRTFEVLDYHPKRGHLDSTSLSVYGQYNSEEEDTSSLHITQGYSKDHRPDLAQVTLQLICEHLSGIPLHMEVLNGNSSDSESFRQTIQSFGHQLYSEEGLCTIVADSKLYSDATLQTLQASRLDWICRVPGTLQAVKELLGQLQPDDLDELEIEGYRSACYTITYAGIAQYWVVYHSQSAMDRERRTLQRRLKKEVEQARKSLKKLQRQSFSCQQDAQAAVQRWAQQWQWHQLSAVQISPRKKQDRPGRPNGTTQHTIYYIIQAEMQFEQDKWEREIFQRSLFILATNQVVDDMQAEAELLQTYKEQQSVERGFRFIKDPNIVASSFFVQKPERVAALLFIMTTCLLVYSALEYRIRQRLNKEEKFVPDQKGKPTQKPTARWIFQLFVGIHVLYVNEQQRIILNLQTQHRDIISLLSYWNFYS